jgi:hypothetical protein
MHRLRLSYPHLPVFGPGGAARAGSASRVVEILYVARKYHNQVKQIRKARPPLMDIHARILKS